MKCENCGNKHDGDYGSGRFCSSKCARGFSTKKKRKEINEKVSKTLIKRDNINIKCNYCGEKIQNPTRRHKKYCSRSCSLKHRWENKEYRDTITKSIQERCNNVEYRKFLTEIGRKGGFGKKGYINGVRYESTIEKECFSYLFEKNIKFLPHKYIANTSRVSDIYLIDSNIWIEIDGINREKRKKWLKEEYQRWLEKIEIYKKNKLNYKIFTSVDSFKDFINGTMV